MSMNENAGMMQLQQQKILKNLSGIKNIIVVMSGKGGVGKSFVASNISVALAAKGHQVGLMDIDVHGPSVPTIMGLEGQRLMSAEGENEILPLQYQENLKVVSVGFMLKSQDTAFICRGPMKTTLIKQFVGDVVWGELDYLIVDAPPGTGDEVLTVAQTIANAKAVIVTTPQDVAIVDVKKSITFCNDLNVEIVGIVENMSSMTCPHCLKEIPFFKKDGGFKLAQYAEVPFLGRIPLTAEIVLSSDNGCPILSSENVPELVAKAFDGIVNKITRI